ncbi:MAG TPA: glycine/sarcosine/betaine reductase component B subunit [Egibacteraceae bacterium]|nr:glycine/sarcosine/betaine reductase component B subunit [Egibacteraceae bacterium]
MDTTTPATGDAPSSLLVHAVEQVVLGDRTAYRGGQLTVGVEQAHDALADPALSSVRVHATNPGDPVRIVKLLDVVEPRTKGPGRGGVFPGFLAPPRPDRPRQTHVLRGAAVMAAGALPRNQEGIVDMSGPAAEVSPYAATSNVVVEFARTDDASWEDVDVALRRGLLRLAVHLADAAAEADPDDVEEWAPPARPGPGDLPRVGVVTNLQTQGSFKDVYVYGRSFATSLPTLIDPFEVDDGAIVGGQFGHPGLRNSTYVHQNHPVVAELRRRHGHDLSFAGLVICPEPVDQHAKDHISAHAARLCIAAGFDAAVVTKEGGGNADADASLKMDRLEDAGIAAVGMFAEFAGPDGTGPPLVFPPRRATAMVSTGNYDERLQLPAMERTLGGDRVDIADADADAAMELPVATIHGSLNLLGGGRLRAQEEAA